MKNHISNNNTDGIQDLRMEWDYAKGNLSKRSDIRKGKEVTFSYDNLDHLTGANVSGGVCFSASYASNGNIQNKTDAGSYSYPELGVPEQSSTRLPALPIPTTEFLPYSRILAIRPARPGLRGPAFQQPSAVTEGNFNLTYTYGADYNRIKSELKENGNTIRTRYYFSGFEKDNTGRYVHYVNSPVGLIAIVENNNTHYIYTDHLGSIVSVTNGGGGIEHELNFDAWGRRRDPNSWALLPPTAGTSLPEWLYRGYTGHEHLDQFGLINMNGRLYDPVLGRMLSPDNYIADAGFTQDYNRYTYAHNNPLLYTDPDGNHPLLISTIIGAFIGGTINGLKYALRGDDFSQGFWRGAITGAIAGLTGYYAPIGFVGGAVYGFGTGAAIGAISAGLNGGNIWRGAGIGALTGAVMGGISGGLQAVMLGRDFFSGAGSIHTMPVEGNLVAGSTPAPYSDEYLYQLKNANYKGVGPGGGMTIDIDPKHATMDADGVLTIKSTGDQALAATVPTIWRRGMSSKIMFGKAAFSSKEQLVVAMAHELGHVVLNNNPKLRRWAGEATGNADQSLNTEGHIAIQKMTGNLILRNGWNPGLFRTQVWDFSTAQSYPQLSDPLIFLIKRITFP